MIAAIAIGIALILVLVAHERERETWRRERSQLLDRIKPETAPPPDGPVGPLLQAIPYDDDKAWAEARDLKVVS